VPSRRRRVSRVDEATLGVGGSRDRVAVDFDQRACDRFAIEEDAASGVLDVAAVEPPLFDE
jgi:hypothetical protein